MDRLRERARQRLRGGLGGRFRGRVDQVGYGFGLRQIQLVIQKGAARELTRLGQAQAVVLARFEHARQQQLQHDGAAMALQFQHVFARVRMRALEVDGDALVDDAAVTFRERQIGGVARFELLRAEQGRHQGSEVFAGGAYHADTAASGSGGDGGDRGRVEFHGDIVDYSQGAELSRIKKARVRRAFCSQAGITWRQARISW